MEGDPPEDRIQPLRRHRLLVPNSNLVSINDDTAERRRTREKILAPGSMNRHHSLTLSSSRLKMSTRLAELIELWRGNPDHQTQANSDDKETRNPEDTESFSNFEALHYKPGIIQVEPPLLSEAVKISWIPIASDAERSDSLINNFMTCDLDASFHADDDD